ncbi:MAG: DUF4097 family beta strand repeat-containing protein [Marinifilaceae bacterium]|jgi:hypothetical protein|nr:DUF4097 family beta strand repeat-containing protein [Marinifilaceae bacterium]
MKLLVSKLFLCIILISNALIGFSTTKTMEFSGINKIVVSARFFDTNIYGSSGNKTIFSYTINDSFKNHKKIHVNHKKVGNTLIIEVETPLRYVNNFEGKIKLSIPKDVDIDYKSSSGDLSCIEMRNNSTNIAASSGDISLINFNSKFNLKTSSGDIKLIECNGDINVKTSSGEQYLRTIKGNVNSISSSGSAKLENVNGKINLVSTSGDSDIIHCIGKMRLTSTSGELELNDCQGEFHASSTSGDIVAKNINFTDESRFSSTSGDIEMKYSNRTEDLRFTLNSTSGSLKVDNKYSDDYLTVGEGSILIKSSTTSGDQVFKKYR